MSRVGVRALKQNASAVVAAAAAGEIVVITDHGRPVAQLVPLPRGRLAELLAAGRARSARVALRDLTPPPRRARGGVPLTAVVAAMREAERP